MKSTSASQQWLIIACFAAVYLVWGSSYIGIHFAIETLPPFLMTGSRFVISGAILITLAVARGCERPTLAHWRSAAISSAFMFLMNNSMIVWAQDNGLPTGVTAVLLATMPMWMVSINWLRGARPTLITVIGLLIGFVGVLVLVNPGSIISREMHPLAPFIVLLAAGAWAFGALYARKAPLPRNGSLATGMQLLTGGIMILIFSAATGDAATLDLPGVSLTSMIAFVHLTLMSSVITFSAFNWLMKTVNPAKVATYSYVNPVIAMILGFALANEPITPTKVIAAAIILGGVVLITAYGSRRIAFRDGRLIAVGEAV